MKKHEVELLHSLMVAVAARVVAENKLDLPGTIRNTLIDRATKVENTVKEALITEGK